MLPDRYSLSAMTHDESIMLGDWASEEGWNPGNGDIELAFQSQPEAFIALRDKEVLIGGGSVMSYDNWGFMGLFILRPEYRQQGLGGQLWHYRRDLLKSRLPEDAAIGMDGVIPMCPYYQKGGFQPAYLHMRFEGIAQGSPQDDLIPLANLTLSAIVEFDQMHLPGPRESFLKAWLNREHISAFATVDDFGQPTGMIVLRPAEKGFKIGPFYALDYATAQKLLKGVLVNVRGELVQIDVPDSNPTAVRLAQNMGFEVNFSCLRLYLGQPRAIPLHQIYGNTALEFG